MVEGDALAKTTRINELYDFYKTLLTEKQQTFLTYYFHENFSLGEIAKEFSISRQAIYEHIKRATDSLELYEAKLKLLHTYRIRMDLYEKISKEYTNPYIKELIALERR